MKLVTRMKKFTLLSAAFLMPSVIAETSLPFDGSFDGLTIDTLKTKYMLHITEMGPKNTKRGIKGYYSFVKPRQLSDGSTEAALQIKVNDTSTFQDQKEFRRNEVVVKFTSIMTIWWEFSLNVPVAFHDQTLDWQVAFPECHCWEVRVQQTGVNQPELQILSNGSYEKPVLKTNFRSNRWYHFGIFTDGVTNKFYFSENHADLKFISTLSPGCDTKNEAFKEYHFGLLSYQKGVHKKLLHAEKIWFSGISADTKINDSKIKGGGGTGSKSAEQNEGTSGGSNYGNQNEDKSGENSKGEKPPVKNESGSSGDYTPGNQNEGNNGGTSQSGEKPPVKNESGGSGESPTPPTNNKKCKRST